MGPPRGLSYGELQEFKANSQRAIRLRVINFLKNWLEKNWKDFIDDPEMTQKLQDFITNDLETTGNQTSAEQLFKLLQRKNEEPEAERQAVFNEPPPKPILPNMKKSGGSSSTLGLLDFSSEEIVRQLTIIEFNMYRAIKPWEFFNQSWTKQDKDVKSPNIIAMIKRFNKISNWVATEIVSAESLKQRVHLLSKFIEIADYCRSYNNFNALMEILSGLQQSSIFRLRQTWNGLGGKQKDLFEQLKELMTRQGNFSALRKHLKACNPPCIPYLGLYLTDLTFIEDGNPDMIEGGTLVNWVKRRRLATVLKDIQQYQQTPFNLEEVPFIQDFLAKREPLPEDQCYKLSLQRETRAPEKEKEGKDLIRRKSLFDFGQRKKDKTVQTPPTSPSAPTKGKTATQDTAAEEDDEDEEFEIQYSPGYKFYDKDSEQNIILEKNKDMDIILAGTLPKLVERLTYEKYPDTNFLTSFLLTFRTFVSPHDLLDLLIMRYHTPPPVNPTPELLEKFRIKKETPIQLRVLNVCKIWIDRYFEDFQQDRTLLTKLVEFVDKSMLPNEKMARAGENMKAQIANKLSTKEEKKNYMFDQQPPEPILPNIVGDAKPELLDYNPLELARQFVLLDFELFTGIKPLEYLHFIKPSSWNMLDEQGEEDPANIKSAPHIVAVVYRSSDRRDWVATEIIKKQTKEERAKVIDHFIQIAQQLVQLKHFQGLLEITSGLSLDLIMQLKSTWKLVPAASLKAFVELRELASYKGNYKELRHKLETIDYPCIPPIAIYLQDIAGIREQMPDTIEPGGFVNFAKRQKMSQLIHEIYQYQQQPYCLKPVESIQSYLKNLDIYELSEMRELSEQYQEMDGDNKIEGSVFDAISLSTESTASPQPTTPQQQNGNNPQNGSKDSPRVLKHSSTSSKGSNTGTPSNLTPSASPTSSPRASVAPRNTSFSNITDFLRMKPMMFGLIQDDGDFRREVREVLKQAVDQDIQKKLDAVLFKEFSGAKIAPWNVNDQMGTVYGWPEQINAKLVQLNDKDLYLVPLIGTWSLDRAELSIHLKVLQVYESMNRFGAKPKLCIVCSDVTEAAKTVALQIGVKLIVV